MMGYHNGTQLDYEAKFGKDVDEYTWVTGIAEALETPKGCIELSHDKRDEERAAFLRKRYPYLTLVREGNRTHWCADFRAMTQLHLTLSGKHSRLCVEFDGVNEALSVLSEILK